MSDALRCTHRPPCPGCPHFGETLLSPRAAGRLAALARFASEAGVALETRAVGPATGYRQRARLAVRGRAGSPKLGIFQEGSHRIVDIPSCLVHDPRINEAAALLKHAIRKTAVEPYADAPHRGLLRYAQLVIERETQTVQLVLVSNSDDAAPLAGLLDALQTLMGSRLHSLFVSPNRERGNAIFGDKCLRICGPEAVRERIAEAVVFYPPDAFGQSNLGGYERIVEQIGAWAEGARVLVEFYAGTGAIGLSLLPRLELARLNELTPGSLRGLCMGIDALPPQLRARAEVLPGGAGDQAARVRHADLVIADPPRKGLDPQLCDALCAHAPPRFLYLSCDPHTFLGDARRLLQAGQLALTGLVAYDLFPFTGHIEVLARFDREPS
jgi:23S rRNA (uracil1939-C5)-methyltransferase